MATSFLAGGALPALASDFGSIQSDTDIGWQKENGTLNVLQLHPDANVRTRGE